MPAHKNRIRFAAALLALAAVPLAAQPETVHLRFGWQPGMRAQVDYEQVRLRDYDGRDSTRIASTYLMDVSSHADGLMVAYSGTRWTELPASDPELGRFYEALTRTASGGRARTVVSAEGRFLRVEGVEAVAGEVAAAVQPLLTDVDASYRQRVRAIISPLLSPQALTAAAAEEWNALVWVWSDEKLEMGEMYEMESSFQFALFPGVRIPLHLELQVVGRVPCTPAESEARCVELGLASFPDREALAEAAADFLERNGAPEELQAIFAQLDVQTYIQLHTEPGTLRPHFLQISRTVGTGPDEGAPRQEEVRTFRYRYLP